MLDSALACIARGWYVFPCRPRTKEPAVKGGFKAATRDELQIRAWWIRWPDANVGIATGASGLCVLDIDAGVDDAHHLCEVIEHKRLSHTYVVRTGRRPGFGLQLYYAGEGLKSIAWQDGELSGDIRCATGYVMAEGSIHPSGERYERLGAFGPESIDFVPEYVRTIPPAIKPGLGLGLGLPNAPVQDDGGKIDTARNNTMIHLLGKARAAGYDDEAIREYALEVNEARFEPPLDEAELDRIIGNVSKYPVPDNGPEVILGGKAAASASSKPDAWSKYHTPDQVINARPVTFLIDGFLTEDAITVIAAPVAQRKSIVALNVVHSLVTGEPLFGHFAVAKRPTRVLYLCPEMGVQSFAARLKSIGLAPYLGTSLFCTTMASDPFDLKDLTPAELEGAVVVLDTAIRFLKGDESSSAEMAVFAASVFRLIKDGAASVLMLHHSKKGTSEASELTLDNVMRGSGELGAFVACVWATRLQDGKDEYKTPSYLENVKKRDFDCEPFQVLPVAGSYRLVYDAKVGGVELSNPSRFKKDKDGKEEQALALIAATRKTRPTLSYLELSRVLEEHGVKRSAEWIRKRDKRAPTPTTGVVVINSPPTTNTP